MHKNFAKRSWAIEFVMNSHKFGPENKNDVGLIRRHYSYGLHEESANKLDVAGFLMSQWTDMVHLAAFVLKCDPKRIHEYDYSSVTLVYSGSYTCNVRWNQTAAQLYGPHRPRFKLSFGRVEGYRVSSINPQQSLRILMEEYFRRTLDLNQLAETLENNLRLHLLMEKLPSQPTRSMRVQVNSSELPQPEKLFQYIHHDESCCRVYFLKAYCMEIRWEEPGGDHLLVCDFSKTIHHSGYRGLSPIPKFAEFLMSECKGVAVKPTGSKATAETTEAAHAAASGVKNRVIQVMRVTYEAFSRLFEPEDLTPRFNSPIRLELYLQGCMHYGVMYQQVNKCGSVKTILPRSLSSVIDFTQMRPIYGFAFISLKPNTPRFLVYLDQANPYQLRFRVFPPAEGMGTWEQKDFEVSCCCRCCCQRLF